MDNVSRQQRRAMQRKLDKMPAKYRETVAEHQKLILANRRGPRAWLCHYVLDRRLGLPWRKAFKLAFKYLELTKLRKAANA